MNHSVKDDAVDSILLVVASGLFIAGTFLLMATPMVRRVREDWLVKVIVAQVELLLINFFKLPAFYESTLEEKWQVFKPYYDEVVTGALVGYEKLDHQRIKNICRVKVNNILKSREPK